MRTHLISVVNVTSRCFQLRTQRIPIPVNIRINLAGNQDRWELDGQTDGPLCCSNTSACIACHAMQAMHLLWQKRTCNGR